MILKYSIKVTPNSKHNEIIEETANTLKVKLKAKPQEGEANKALINFLADHFKVRKSDVKILKGLSSKNKIIEVNLNQTSTGSRV